MIDDKYSEDTEPEKHEKNNLILQDIMRNVAFLIKTNNINKDESIPHFVKSSLETTYIDIALYLENKDKKNL